MAGNFGQQLSAYEGWLRQTLAENTRRIYLLQIRQYVAYLKTRASQNDDPLHGPFARDHAVRDYKMYLKTEGKAKPSSINLALAAIDHFYLFLGIGRPQVKREDLLEQLPRLLNSKDQQAFLHAVEHSSSVRDKAIALLLLYTGLHLRECVDLNVDDVYISGRNGLVIVHSKKIDTYLALPLNAEVREALKIWIKERTKCIAPRSEAALFLSLEGKRLSTFAISRAIRQQGTDAKFELSAHMLRCTYIANLFRHRGDLALVTEATGSKCLETMHQYSLPHLQGRENAIEGFLTGGKEQYMSESKKTLKVFYCYAHKDKILREQLENHLEPLKRSGQIVSWHDREILPGADWAQEISINLNTAHIILLLISRYFISSDYCYGIEMRQALERHKEGNAYVIPIIMRPVEWKETPIGILQALPDGGKPITLWRNRDEAFQCVVQGIRKVIEVFQDRKYKRFLDYLTGLCCPKCSHGNAITTAIEGNRRLIWCMHCGSNLFSEEL